MSTKLSSIRQALAAFNPTGAYADLGKLLQLRFAARDLHLFVKRPVKSLLAGAERTRFRGRGMDFEEVRLYQPGDDVRAIDWRVTARTQVPHTKLYREERERPVFVVVDQRSPMFFGSRRCFKSVTAAHITANLAWAALNNSDRIGGLIIGNQTQRDIRPRRSKHAVLELLHQVFEFNQSLKSPVAQPGDKTLIQLLKDTRRLAKPGCALFIISDFHDYDTQAEQQLFELARHTDVTLMQVYDPLERQLRSHSRLTVSNGRQRLELSSDDTQFQDRYEQNFATRQTHFVQSAKRLGIPLLVYSTDADLQSELREQFSAS